MKKNNKGFTLAELLIVVAIIAVLVAIAIPIFSVQMEKSREETDIANLRAAKAGAVAMLMDGKDLEGNTITDGATVYFDANSGNLVASKPSKGYGKGTAMDGKAQEFITTTQVGGTEAYDNKESVQDKVIVITFNLKSSDTYLTMGWE